jgi:hypothetical protein
MAADKEVLLRQELHFLGNLSFRLTQWGVTLLVSLWTVLYFVRKEVTATLIQRHELSAGQPLPWNHYGRGTFVLLVVALIFTELNRLMGLRWIAYNDQLKDCQSGIKEPSLTGRTRLLFRTLFLIFPLMDFGFRLFKITIE